MNVNCMNLGETILFSMNVSTNIIVVFIREMEGGCIPKVKFALTAFQSYKGDSWFICQLL